MLKGISVSKTGDLTITIGTNGSTLDQLPLSKSGKSFVIASTGGFSNVANINVTVANPNYVAPEPVAKVALSK